MAGIHYFSKNYLKFIDSLRHDIQDFHCHQQQLTQAREDVNTPGGNINQIGGLNEQQLTLQNMLGEDSEFTRRSIKPTKQGQTSNKNLFQINEDEEEEPFSPSKNNYSEIQVDDSSSQKNALGENRNITNQSNNMKIFKVQPGVSDYDYKINDPPQFCSYNKNNDIEGENMSSKGSARENKNLKNAYSDANLLKNKIGKSTTKNLNLRPKSQLKSSRYQNSQLSNINNAQSNYGLSDDTTILEGGILNQANTSSKNLNICDNDNDSQYDIEKFSQDQRKVQTVQKRLSIDNKNHTPQKNDLSQGSKEESKDEDSSRILMMRNRGPNSSSTHSRESLMTSKQHNQSKDKKQLITIIIILASIALLILSIGFICYSFYNMTAQGILNALTIFGLSLLLDLLIIRLIVISIYTLVNTIFQVKRLQKSKIIQKKVIEDEEISLLQDIYLEYKAPINHYLYNHVSVQIGNKSNVERDEESSDQQINVNQPPSELNPQDQINNYSSNQRFLKFQPKSFKSAFGELMLVESTYFYHQPQMMPLSEIKKQIEQQEQLQQAKHESGGKRKLKLGEKVEISDTMQFDADRDLKLRQAHHENNKDRDQSSIEIEEIPMDSIKKEEKIEYIMPYDDQEAAQQQDNLNRSSILPPILTSHHQFETPKGLHHAKAQFSRPILPGVNISQQAIAFNELRESMNEKNILLRNPSALNSNSSKKKQVHQQEYQSLQRYLNEDKENQNSINHSLKKRPSIGASGHRSKKYLDAQQLEISPSQNVLNLQHNQDDIIQFTPQYNSLYKKNTVPVEKSTLKNESIRKSMALPEMFFDLNEVNLISQLNKSKSKKKRSRKSSAVKKTEQNKENNPLNTDRDSLKKKYESGRKTFNSPTKIKENLEERIFKLNQMSNQRQSINLISMNKPDVSPFHNNQSLHDNNGDDEIYHEAPTMNIPSPRQLNILQSIEFNNMMASQDQMPKFRESTNSNNLKQFLQPQLMLQKTKEKQKKEDQHYQKLETNQSETTINLMNDAFNVKPLLNSSVENTLEQKTKEIVTKSKLNNSQKPKIKPRKLSKKKQKLVMQNTFQTEENQKSFISNTLGNLMKFTEEQQEISEINRETHNNSRQFDETCRSKMFEDSDQSTFRMINFTGAAGLGSRQKSKRQIPSQNDNYATSQTSQNFQTENSSQAPIDFYSNISQPLTIKDEETKKIKEYKTQQDYQKRSKKPSLAEVILEENIMTVNSSPEKNNKIAIFNIQQSGSSKKINTFRQDNISEEIEDDNIGEFNLVNKIEELNQVLQDKQITEESNMNECNFSPKESNLAQYMNNKKSGYQKQRRPQPNRMSDTDLDQQLQRERFQSTFDSQNVNQNLKQQEEARRKREEQEMLQLRIEEQRRKLKNFLKLARQLKSTKDEKKIKEFLKFLKQEQKSLPIKKINELKSLEIMSSPYNQSLIDMIKDEYDKFNKVEKKQQNDQQSIKPKPSKSQLRNETKHNDMISKLGGIYGQSIGNSQYNSKQKDLSQKTRAESVAGDFKLKQNLAPTRSKVMSQSRQKFSRESSSSTVEQSMRFKKRGKRNQIQLLDSNTHTNQTLSGVEDSQVITLKNQLRVENYGQTTSEEEDNHKQVKLIETKNKIEIRASEEFNNLESYMAQ